MLLSVFIHFIINDVTKYDVASLRHQNSAAEEEHCEGFCFCFASSVNVKRCAGVTKALFQA